MLSVHLNEVSDELLKIYRGWCVFEGIGGCILVRLMKKIPAVIVLYKYKSRYLYYPCLRLE